MLISTVNAIRAVLQTDETITTRDRNRFLTLVRHELEPPQTEAALPAKPTAQRIVRRREAAQMYGCSLRLIDRLAAQGVLPKVRLPGRQRAAGFLEADLLALINGKEAL